MNITANEPKISRVSLSMGADQSITGSLNNRQWRGKASFKWTSPAHILNW